MILKKEKTKKTGKIKKKFDGTEKIKPVSIIEFSIRNTKIYGSYTIQQRALSDFRDGLKPVHRRILWAMYCLGLHNSGSFKKSARTIGDVIGKYHPHGDSSAYEAMVSIACSVGRKGKIDWTNSPEPLISGQGNFGGLAADDKAAAQRYTEAKLSKFADQMLLDPQYIAVSTMVSNFDGEEKEPIILPAKLPYLLLGGCDGIATGVSTYIPSFSQKSVTRLVRHLLETGEKATPKLCYKYLEFKFANGGNCISSKSEIINYFETGKGSLNFMPDYTINDNNRLVTLTSVTPRFTLEDKHSKKGVKPGKMSKLAALDGVVSVSEDSDRHTGFQLNIHLKKKLEPTALEKTLKAIKKELTVSLSFQTAVTERMDDGETVKFRYTNISTILDQWIAWRIDLELKVIANQLCIKQKELDKLTLLQLAAKNLDIMKQTMDVTEPIKLLQKLKLNGVKLTEEQANYLLGLTFKSLTKLSRKKLLDNISSVKKEIRILNKYLDDPKSRILENL